MKQNQLCSPVTPAPNPLEILMSFDKEEQKEIFKEALKEWLDEKFAVFGRWAFKGMLAAAFTGLIYIALKGKGLL